MKKILALAMALLLAALTLSTAMADTSPLNTLSLSDPKIYYQYDDETQMVDLTGVTAKVGVDLYTPIATAQLTQGANSLVNGFVTLQNNKIILAVEGMGNAYAIDLNRYGVPAELGQYVYLLGALGNVKLPKLGAVNIPKIDLSALLSSFVTGSQPGDNGATVTNFTIPASTLNSLLETGVQYAQMMGMSAYMDQLGVNEMMDEMRRGGMGLQLNGTVTDYGNRSVTTLSLYPMQNNQLSPAPAAVVTLESMANDLRVTAAPDGAGQEAAELRVTSNPAAQMLTISMKAQEAAEITLSLYPQNTLQVMDLQVKTVDDESAVARVAYGNYGGQDLMIVEASGKDWDGEEVFAFSYTRSAVKSGKGFSGSIDLIARSGRETYEVVAGLRGAQEALRSGNFPSLTNPIDIEMMTGAQQDQLDADMERIMETIQNALANVQPVTVQPAQAQ